MEKSAAQERPTIPMFAPAVAILLPLPNGRNSGPRSGGDTEVSLALAFSTNVRFLTLSRGLVDSRGVLARPLPGLPFRHSRRRKVVGNWVFDAASPDSGVANLRASAAHTEAT
jgi:hypothetical protein